MSGHTKGPWTRSDGWTPNLSVVDHENIYGSPPAGVVAKVVRASQDGRYTDEKEANARLIAAAPEMYDGISVIARLLTQALDDFGHEADCDVDEDGEGCTCQNKPLWKPLRSAEKKARALLAKIDGAA